MTRQLLESRFADYDALPPERQAQSDAERLVPVPELRRLLRAWDADFHKIEANQAAGRKGGRRRVARLAEEGPR